jgi:hypothetical protein
VDVHRLREAIAIPALPHEWRTHLQQLLDDL